MHIRTDERSGKLQLGASPYSRHPHVWHTYAEGPRDSASQPRFQMRPPPQFPDNTFSARDHALYRRHNSSPKPMARFRHRLWQVTLGLTDAEKSEDQFIRYRRERRAEENAVKAARVLRGVDLGTKDHTAVSEIRVFQVDPIREDAHAALSQVVSSKSIHAVATEVVGTVTGRVPGSVRRGLERAARKAARRSKKPTS